MELELVAQEKNVGPFRADILCRNVDGGSWVLIENQLERTDHKHLGQLLTYAAGLQVVSICWVAASFTDEHRATLDWLNEITDDRFQFFGLEVELWRIGDSLAAPKFNVVSQPNSWSRAVTEIRSGSGGLTRKQNQQRAFWSQLMEQLKQDESPVRPKKPQPQGWMEFSIGRADFWLEATITAAKRRICVSLFMGGENATAYFKLLEQQREDIEAELTEPVEWRASPGRKSSSIRVCRTEIDPTQEQDWPRQLEWMATTLGRFHRTFSRRVTILDPSDWEGDHDPGES